MQAQNTYMHCSISATPEKRREAQITITDDALFSGVGVAFWSLDDPCFEVRRGNNLQNLEIWRAFDFPMRDPRALVDGVALADGVYAFALVFESRPAVQH